MTRRDSRLAAFVFAGLVTFGADAAAQQPPPEPYIAKFNEGRALVKQEKWAEALEKFQDSANLKPGSGTLLNIGDCQEHLQKYASAVTSFEQARALAAEEKKPEREKEAADRATKLQPMISTVTIKAPADAQLSIDGGAAGPGAPVSVDGGAHTVRVEIKCKKPREIPITVGNKADTATVNIDVATLDPDPACAPPPAPGMSTERLLSYVAGGAGVVALGVGIGFGLSASSKEGDLEDMCPSYPSHCSRSQRTALEDKYDSASTSATISTIGFIGAVALLAGGVVLYVISPEWKRGKTTGKFVPGRFTF